MIWWTLNGTWGYSASNQRWKTVKELVHELVDVVSRGGNFLLNIGPMPDGSIPKESVALFKGIGNWMKENGEAIYETRANPFDVEFPWGRVTRKGDNTLFSFTNFLNLENQHPLQVQRKSCCNHAEKQAESCSLPVRERMCHQSQRHADG